ncbi:MAG TPA: AFG1/ZapE family ATPase [bacterium]|jgi:DNA replication protein DnaC
MQAREGLAVSACHRCDGTGVVVRAIGATAEAALCECSQRCLTCGGARYLFQRDPAGREIARMCECELRRVRIRLYNEARVPGKYALATLSERYRDRHNQVAFNTFRLLAKDYQRGHKGLLLMGPAGVGKTHLVAAFIRELIFSHGIPVMFRDFFHLLADLRSGYSNDTPESQVIDPLVAVEVLVIDELGKGRNTPWEQNILDVIISQRYNNEKTTIFTSNYTDSRRTTLAEHIRPKDGSTTERQEIRDTLAERVGPRIYSRLKEMCDFITLSGPDRREQEGATVLT